MIVLSEAYLRPLSASVEELIQAETAARQAGSEVFPIPADFTFFSSIEQALIEVPTQPRRVWGVWIGFIPSEEHYAQIYQAALNKNINLLNSPEQFRRVQEFDQAYPFLQGLTPESQMVTTLEQCLAAFQSLGAPIFVKGAIQSRKRAGLQACLAQTQAELHTLVQDLLERPQFSNGTVILRRWIPLRKTGSFGEDFPKGREYRAFVLHQQVLALGYYWQGEDPCGPLTEKDLLDIQALIQTAATRLQVPYFSIDLGQAEDGKWWVIETGDAQFTSLGQIKPERVWTGLNRRC